MIKCKHEIFSLNEYNNLHEIVLQLCIFAITIPLILLIDKIKMNTNTFFGLVLFLQYVTNI